MQELGLVQEFGLMKGLGLLHQRRRRPGAGGSSLPPCQELSEEYKASDMSLVSGHLGLAKHGNDLTVLFINVIYGSY